MTDKTKLNGWAQHRYDELMRVGTHGHYETLFHLVHEARSLALEDAATLFLERAENCEYAAAACDDKGDTEGANHYRLIASKQRENAHLMRSLAAQEQEVKQC